jgi:hypothetical protein
MTDYRMTCRHCGGRFLEMVDLLYHACPNRPDAHKGRQNRKRRPGRGNLRTKAQGLFPAAEGRR